MNKFVTITDKANKVYCINTLHIISFYQPSNDKTEIKLSDGSKVITGTNLDDLYSLITE